MAEHSLNGRLLVPAVGRYRIHAVSEMTGVPEATLRAWERRYNVPVPVRTPAGYRLYSQLDVELVQRMRELCAKGMAPVDAARLVSAPGRSAPHVSDLDADPYDVVSNRIVEATRRLDPAAIEAEVRLAMSLGDAVSVVERVFCPALSAIGLEWECGRLTVGHEHLASEILASSIRDLLRLVGPARPQGEVVLACLPEEQHVLPLYAAAFRFIEWGYRPHLLGARTPPSGLSAAVQQIEPVFVGLSATLPLAHDAAGFLMREYARLLHDQPWAVGGAAASALRLEVERHGGHVVCGTPEEQREEIGRLLHGSRTHVLAAQTQG